MDPAIFDKNKSAYKLKNFGPLYYLNLDGQPERRQYMEDQFKYWEIENYTRISAYDGRDDDLSDIISGRYPDTMSGGEIGCTTSHLNAIKHYLDNSDSPYAIIMEDDCNLELAKFWNFTWTDFMAHAPYDYDVIQIAIICTGDIHVRLHKRFVNDFSTACYMITRHHAKKLMDLCYRDGKYKLDYKAKPRCNSEHLIYESGNSFAMPVLLFSPPHLESMIWNKEHIDAFHVPSRDGLREWWTNEAPKLQNWEQLFEYDPYMGPVSYTHLTLPTKA